MQSETLFGKTISYDNKAKITFLFVTVFALLLCIKGVASLWEAVEKKKRQVVQTERLIANANKTSDNDGDDKEQYLFQGENLAEVQSNLQEKVKTIGDRYQIAIDSIQALDPVTEQNITVNRIRLNGAIPGKQFAPFLLELSKNQPSVFVSDVDIRPARVRAARVANVAEVEPKLSIQLVFSGLSKAGSEFALR